MSLSCLSQAVPHHLSLPGEKWLSQNLTLHRFQCSLPFACSPASSPFLSCLAQPSILKSCLPCRDAEAHPGVHNGMTKSFCIPPSVSLCLLGAAEVSPCMRTHAIPKPAEWTMLRAVGTGCTPSPGPLHREPRCAVAVEIACTVARQLEHLPLPTAMPRNPELSSLPLPFSAWQRWLLASFVPWHGGGLWVLALQNKKSPRGDANGTDGNEFRAEGVKLVGDRLQRK